MAWHRIPLGICNTYLLAGDGYVLVDAGPPRKEKALRAALAKLEVAIDDIRLIVITHGHWDHVGSAARITAATGAKLAMSEHERTWLEEGKIALPPGRGVWGSILAGVGHLTRPFSKIETASVDILLGDDELSLADWGVPGRIIATPGHSPGSVSVLLDDGTAFVGDMAMNGFPLRRGPGLPIFAEDLDQLRQSWRALLALGVTSVHPAHGDGFSAEIMAGALAE